jgi:hypothetical protein
VFGPERTMSKVLRGFGKDKNGNPILIGAMPIPFSKDKCPPATRREKRHLVRQGATIFKKETDSSIASQKRMVRGGQVHFRFGSEADISIVLSLCPLDPRKRRFVAISGTSALTAADTARAA